MPMTNANTTPPPATHYYHHHTPNHQGVQIALVHPVITGGKARVTFESTADTYHVLFGALHPDADLSTACRPREPDKMQHDQQRNSRLAPAFNEDLLGFFLDPESGNLYNPNPSRKRDPNPNRKRNRNPDLNPDPNPNPNLNLDPDSGKLYGGGSRLGCDAMAGAERRRGAMFCSDGEQLTIELDCDAGRCVAFR